MRYVTSAICIIFDKNICIDKADLFKLYKVVDKLIFASSSADVELIINISRNSNSVLITRVLCDFKDLYTCISSIYYHSRLSNIDSGEKVKPISANFGKP